MNRIALCLECPIYQHGGVEILVRALINGLDDKFEIFLVSVDSYEGIKNTEVSSKIMGHFQWIPEDKSYIQIKKLISWSKENHINLFHFHHGGTYGWNSRSWNHCAITEVARSGFRSVSTNHGAFGFWFFVGGQRSILYRLLAMCVCWPAKMRQIASVEWEATVSNHDYMAVRHWFFPLKSRFIQIYHSILDEETLPVLPKRNIILCLGTVGPRKGQPYLVDAFAKVAADYPEWKLVIAGRHANDVTTDKILNAISRNDLGKQVDIITDVSDTLAHQLLAEAAIFAMPSLAEGLGLSLQEALYARAACIGSKVGGIQDLILDEHTGLLVPPANPLILAKGLRRLMADPALRQRLGNCARQHIIDKGMTRKGMLERHISLYEKQVSTQFNQWERLD